MPIQEVQNWILLIFNLIKINLNILLYFLFGSLRLTQLFDILIFFLYLKFYMLVVWKNSETNFWSILCFSCCIANSQLYVTFVNLFK